MKNLLSLFVLIIFSQSGFSQSEKVWVFFTDKGPSVDTKVAHPEKYLSLKAIYRRQNQDIDIHESDVPVYNGYLDIINDLGVKVVGRSKWLNAVSVEIQEQSQKSRERQR